MPRARLLLPTLVAALALGVAGCGSDDDGGGTPSSTAAAPASTGAAAPAAAVDKIDIKDFKYDPADATVEVGAKITFTNEDTAPHTATTDDKQIDTGTLMKGQSKTVTFSKPGTYNYICLFHPYMKGTITVK